MATDLIPGDYSAWLESVKSRIQSARSRAALAVNAELIQLYHSIGSDILERQTRHSWGSKVIARVAADLKAAFPDMKGFSTRNLHYMRLFAEQCPSTPIVQQAAAQLEQETLGPGFGQQAAAQLPWFHIVTLLTQAEPTEREWYAVHAIAGGWSRHTLQTNLKNRLKQRQGAAVTNFASLLPAPQSALAQETLKDPYLFDFLGLADDAHEREIENALATAACKWLRKKGEIICDDSRSMDREIEAIASTCGLIHDLGNPPFGHAGEEAIQFWFRKNLGESTLKEQLNGQQANDFLKFEGNAQTLRILTRLQILADFYGLNLTYGTLSAACKYVASSTQSKKDHSNHSFEKPGYFTSENEVVQQIRELTGTGERRNPITFLVEAADDIVYSVADIEDGVKKGVLRWNDVADDLKTLRDESAQRALSGMDHILKAGRSELPKNLSDDVKASAFRTAAIGVFVPSVVKVFEDNYSAIMAGTFENELIKASTSAVTVKKLKSIGANRVYCTQPTLKLELMGRRVIGDLFDIFWEGVQAFPETGPPSTKTFAGKIGALMSRNYAQVFQHSVADATNTLPVDYHRFQFLTDYVCGMTDTFAKRLHSELTNG